MAVVIKGMEEVGVEEGGEDGRKVCLLRIPENQDNKEDKTTVPRFRTWICTQIVSNEAVIHNENQISDNNQAARRSISAAIAHRPRKCGMRPDSTNNMATSAAVLLKAFV